MRGVLLVLVLAASLVVPSAAAQMTWYLPETVYAGHPIDVGVRFHDETEGPAVPHSAMAFTAYLDQRPFFSTPDIHEHEGFHSFTITAPRDGRLLLAANDAYPHDFVGDSGKVRTEGSRGETVWVWVEPDARAGGAPVLDPFANATWVRDGSGFRSEPGGLAHEVPQTLWYDVRGTDGDLLLHYTGQHPYPEPVAFIEAPGQTMTPHVFWGPASSNATPVVGRLFDGPSAPGPEAGKPATYPWGVLEDECTLGDRTLFVDPPSALRTGLAWGEDTVVRLALLSADRGGHYPNADLPLHGDGTRERVSYALIGDGFAWHARPSDPYHQVQFRAPEPGTWILSITGSDGVACSLPFTALPRDPIAPPGTLETTHDEDDIDGNVTVTFTARGDDGKPLPHYEFETRVFHEDGLGRATLLWAGKLHGHDGSARFTLHDPLPGRYIVQAYPTPELHDVPRVVADDENGFRTEFWVAGTPPPMVQEVMEDAQSVPALAFPVALIGVALALLRRRDR